VVGPGVAVPVASLERLSALYNCPVRARVLEPRGDPGEAGSSDDPEVSGLEYLVFTRGAVAREIF